MGQHPGGFGSVSNLTIQNDTAVYLFYRGEKNLYLSTRKKNNFTKKLTDVKLLDVIVTVDILDV